MFYYIVHFVIKTERLDGLWNLLEKFEKKHEYK
jgi:hypothetical protein